MAGWWSCMNPEHLSGNLLLIQERFLLGKELSQFDHAPSALLLTELLCPFTRGGSSLGGRGMCPGGQGMG